MSQRKIIVPASRQVRSAGFVLRRGLVVSAWSLALAAAAFAGPFYPDGATTMHFTFEGSPGGDQPIIRPPGFYHADDGFGFVNSPDLVGTALGVTAPKYFRFDLNLPPGTYAVTVVLGGTREESITSIKAGHLATDLQDLHVLPRQNVVKSFTVTVPARPAGAAPLAEDGRLVLEFEGTNPSLMKLDVKPGAAPRSPGD
jgi:hypothetical protein